MWDKKNSQSVNPTRLANVDTYTSAPNIRAATSVKKMFAKIQAAKKGTKEFVNSLQTWIMVCLCTQLNRNKTHVENLENVLKNLKEDLESLTNHIHLINQYHKKKIQEIKEHNLLFTIA